MQIAAQNRYVKVFYLAAASEYEKDLIHSIDTKMMDGIVSEQLEIAQKIIAKDESRIIEKQQKYNIQPNINKVKFNKENYCTTEFLYNYKHAVIFEDIEKVMKRLTFNTISYPLFVEPRNYTFKNETEKKLLYNSYYQTLNVNIGPILRNIFYNENVKAIRLETLLKMIRNTSEISVTNLNYDWLNDAQMKDFILNHNKVRAFRYVNSNEINILFKQNEIEEPPTVTFGDINIDVQNKKAIELHKLNADMGSDIPNKVIAGLFTTINLAYHSMKDNKMDLEEYPNVWRAAYFLNCEYYENDETDFIKNHAIRNRDISKVAGMYFGNLIILKNGTVKEIECKPGFKFTSTFGKYVYKIRFGKKLTSTQFMIRLLFYINMGTEDKITITENANRYICNKCNRSLIYKLYKMSGVNIKDHVDVKSDYFNVEQKGVLCGLLLNILCEVQLRTWEEGKDETFICTPFDLI